MDIVQPALIYIYVAEQDLSFYFIVLHVIKLHIFDGFPLENRMNCVKLQTPLLVVSSYTYRKLVFGAWFPGVNSSGLILLGSFRSTQDSSWTQEMWEEVLGGKHQSRIHLFVFLFSSLKAWMIDSLLG